MHTPTYTHALTLTLTLTQIIFVILTPCYLKTTRGNTHTHTHTDDHHQQQQQPGSICMAGHGEDSVLGRAGGLYQACPNPYNLTPGVRVYAVWLWLRVCVYVCVCRRELSVLDRAGGPYQACPNPATLPQERLHLSVCLCMCLSQIISQVLPFHACVCMRLSTPQLQGILGQVQNDRVTCFRLHFNYVCRCVRLQFGCICFMCAGVCVRLQFVFICFLCASGFGFILASFHVCVPQVCLSHLKLRVTSAELAGP